MGVNGEQKRGIEIPKQPPMFCMLLRKYIENAKITAYTGNYETFEKTWAVQHENAVNMAKKTEEQRQHFSAPRRFFR